MAVFDLQVFIQERLRAFDESIDVTSGSPADTQLIQPILRRLGIDPFTVDMATFLSDRLRQAFPELATNEGDALTDLLVKPAVLLWDPVVREIYRIRACQSWRDSSTLTTDEAEALGANMFVDRNRGDFSRGTGRIYYAQPRSVSATPVNFFTSKGGLHFYPDGQQDITVQEMMLNVDQGMYYFDVSLIAEAAGSGYNIDAKELVTVANLEGTLKVTNLRRFRSGDDAETSVEYVDRASQGLTERSLVTIRGIGARVPKAFPEVSRLGVVGFGDPEMQRDVLKGGGLGPVLVGGTLGQTVVDQETRSTTRRLHVQDAGVDFLSLLDSNSLSSYVLTVAGCYGSLPKVRDLNIKRIENANTLDTVEQVFLTSYQNLTWTLRKKELTLSGIPGGILFPDSALGTVAVPDDEVHVGGMFDVSVRGAAFDSSTLTIENITDANPASKGVDCQFLVVGQATLADLVLGVTYQVGDSVYVALENAARDGFVLQVQTGVNAGNYRVLHVSQDGVSPVLDLDSSVPVQPGGARWQLVDVIDIDLVEPKTERVSGTDMQSTQNSDVLSTSGSTDLAALGVSENDIIRITSGEVAADYEVKALTAFNSVRVDRALTATATNLHYTIYRMNPSGGVLLPLMRISKIEMLDTSGQPVGTIVPYAHPIDVQSRSFENPGRGTKVEVFDGRLGILTIPEPVGGFAVGGMYLQVKHLAPVPPTDVTFTVGNKTRAQLVAELNAAAEAQFGIGTVMAREVLDGSEYRVGIIPLTARTVINYPAATLTALFGNTLERSSLDVCSKEIEEAGGWVAVVPAIDQDNLDVVQVASGNQVGFYGNLTYVANQNAPLKAGNLSKRFSYPAFSPEVGVRVQVGARSIGSARCYFLDPTTIEVNEQTVFSARQSDGSELRYFPDPTLDYVKLPAYPSTSLIKDGHIPGAGTIYLESTSLDFILSSVVIGDHLVPLYVPLIGTTTLGTSVVVANKQLVLSLGGNADQTIVFSHDSSTIPDADVTTTGVASQINKAVGKPIAKVGSGNHLELEGDMLIVVRGSTSPNSANAALGFPTTDIDNGARHHGTYSIVMVEQTKLHAIPLGAELALSVNPESRVAFEIRRVGAQRVNSTKMNAQTAETGLYFFDVQLVSEGTGDQYNLASGTQLSISGHRSDGYFLTTKDSRLTFSTTENLTLHVSRSIQEVGVADDPSNATQLTGQNLEITYDRAGLVADVQNFTLSETERVVCSNPLARHLVPHFVRFDFSYIGGSSADIVGKDIREYITGLFPQDYLESGELNSIAYRRGASSVSNPINMLAVVYNYDRTIWAQRSQDALNTGRLAAFVPDVINISRKTG